MGKQSSGTGRRSGWKQWTAAEACAALREWESSGEPLEGFARRHGWTAQRLRWWQKRQGDWKEGRPGVATLAPVVVTGQPAARPGPAVTLRAGDLVVEVADVEVVPATWLSAFMTGLGRSAA
jgi:hypothetical protein